MNERFEQLGLRGALRIYEAVRHAVFSAIGEYAETLVRSGAQAAAQEFPELQRHLAAGCRECRLALWELTAALQEPPPGAVAAGGDAGASGVGGWQLLMEEPVPAGSAMAGNEEGEEDEEEQGGGHDDRRGGVLALPGGGKAYWQVQPVEAGRYAVEVLVKDTGNRSVRGAAVRLSVADRTLEEVTDASGLVTFAGLAPAALQPMSLAVAAAP